MVDSGPSGWGSLPRITTWKAAIEAHAANQSNGIEPLVKTIVQKINQRPNQDVRVDFDEDGEPSSLTLTIQGGYDEFDSSTSKNLRMFLALRKAILRAIKGMSLLECLVQTVTDYGGGKEVFTVLKFEQEYEPNNTRDPSATPTNPPPSSPDHDEELARKLQQEELDEAKAISLQQEEIDAAKAGAKRTRVDDDDDGGIEVLSDDEDDSATVARVTPRKRAKHVDDDV
jgi:hypothetical protein